MAARAGGERKKATAAAANALWDTMVDEKLQRAEESRARESLFGAAGG